MLRDISSLKNNWPPPCPRCVLRFCIFLPRIVVYGLPGIASVVDSIALLHISSLGRGQVFRDDHIDIGGDRLLLYLARKFDIALLVADLHHLRIALMTDRCLPFLHARVGVERRII